MKTIQIIIRNGILTDVRSNFDSSDIVVRVCDIDKNAEEELITEVHKAEQGLISDRELVS